MPALALVPYVAAEDGPLAAYDLIECPRFTAVLCAVRCVDRHVARWPSGMRKGAPKFPPCSACPRGAAYRARLGGYVPPPDSQPAEMPSNAQRAAKVRWALSHVEATEVERDPLAEVALMTPDDRGIATSGA